MKKITVLTMLLTLSFIGFAQHEHHNQVNNANSDMHLVACRGDVNYIANLPSPELMDGIGISRLKITTTSPLAQKYFSQV